MIRIIAILFFLFFELSVSAQWIKPIIVKDIDSLEIVDADFKPILDTIISIEKQRWYYNEYKLYFFIATTNFNEIIISTSGLLYDTQLFGLFFYNGEKFIVRNYNLGDRLFKIAGIKVVQDFIIYDGFWINEETGEKRKMGHLLNDSHSTWLYKYNEEGKLELVEFVNTENPSRR